MLSAHWLTFFYSVQSSGIAVATLTFATFPLFTVLMEALRVRRFPSWVEIAAGLAIIIAVSLIVDLNDRGPKFLGALVGLSSAILYAIFSIQSKKLVSNLHPVTVSFSQNLVVALSLAPFLPFVSAHPQSLSDWGWLIVLGFVTTALMHQLFLFSLARLSAATCSAFIALEPIYAVIFAALLFKQSLTGWVALSALLIVGASIVLLRSEGRVESRKNGS